MGVHRPGRAAGAAVWSTPDAGHEAEGHGHRELHTRTALTLRADGNSTRPAAALIVMGVLAR